MACPGGPKYKKSQIIWSVLQGFPLLCTTYSFPIEKSIVCKFYRPVTIFHDICKKIIEFERIEVCTYLQLTR